MKEKPTTKTSPNKPRGWFDDKFFIREDMNVEPFTTLIRGRHNYTVFFNYMRRIGNCFATRELAEEKALKMRKILAE